MSYPKSALVSLAVGTAVLTAIAMGFFITLDTTGSMAQMFGLAFNTAWMAALGAAPFVVFWIATMVLLEARWAWASKARTWLAVALVISAPGQLFLVALTNMGDPAPGTEKIWSWDALWTVTPATIAGALAGWWSRHNNASRLEASAE